MISSIGSCSSLSFGAKSIKTELGLKRCEIGFPKFVGSSVLLRNVSAFRGRAKACRTQISITVESTSFYDILGISENGTLEEIKKAYKVLARKYHPDVSSLECMEEHTKRFIMVKEAYETLSDPLSRALYDKDLECEPELMAFSGRKQSENDVAGWKCRWQSQLNELKRRNMNKSCRGTTGSWGSRMRRQRDYDN